MRYVLNFAYQLLTDTISADALQMVYIECPDIAGSPRDLPFFLAMEEYAARRLTAFGECFFMWRVEPTVIYGRHQQLEAEVDTSYCREHGIQVVRRKSGGGCVYADKGNVMLSYICDGENVSFIYNRYINMLVLSLYNIGVKAATTVRNDILVDGRKVSGTAFYRLPGRSIVHGTLLYDTDMENMTRSITPPPSKLQKNGVQSVRQRIGLLKDYTDLPLPEIICRIRALLCKDETYTLTAEDISEIERIREGYL